MFMLRLRGGGEEGGGGGGQVNADNILILSSILLSHS